MLNTFKRTISMPQAHHSPHSISQKLHDHYNNRNVHHLSSPNFFRTTIKTISKPSTSIASGSTIHHSYDQGVKNKITSYVTSSKNYTYASEDTDNLTSIPKNIHSIHHHIIPAKQGASSIKYLLTTKANIPHPPSVVRLRQTSTVPIFQVYSLKSINVCLKYPHKITNHHLHL